MTSATQKPINILSLDGGGMRGLSSLLLLRGLMERLAVKKGITPPASIRPCDYFDLMIGTGTGGISALLLGRMRMTVDEAIEQYLRIAEIAFETPTSSLFAVQAWKETSTSDLHELEFIIGDIVQKFLGDRKTKMEDLSKSQQWCHTAVLAITSASVDTPPYVFRSYPTHQPSSQFSIIEVVRATIATASIFKPVLLGTPPMKFIDAGLAGYNNPVEVGLAEAGRLWEGRGPLCGFTWNRPPTDCSYGGWMETGCKGLHIHNPEL